MDCCGPSRRQALLWAGLAATAGALATGGTAETEAAGAATTAGPATAAGGELLVRDLDVVTVTDTSVVITWFTGSPTAQDAFGFPNRSRPTPSSSSAPSTRPRWPSCRAR